ncbi:MAG: SDR family NAD(P)-dependent oxidoreductase, partial [Pseudomonadota bacterium]
MTWVLITGANRGIGAALAADAHARGWDVIRASRCATMDLTFDQADPDSVFAAAQGFDGSIDVLINNAGIIGPDRQSTLDMDWAGMAQTFAVNVAGPLAVSQAFLPNLRQSDHGRILTISSKMAWMGYAKSDRIAYRASKTAVNKVMQGLATDLMPDGIAVASINPGWVRTDMGGAEADLDPAGVAHGVLNVAQDLTVEGTGKF